ncbi:penicillin-binding protein 1A [Alkalitalea saponilacus]|uniref:Penicillin-binding protein 1A n=1 Tax=Alkalitalea saponilacus TaxID=889453 RepID=A0A1T5HNH9_9BACT|nr:transglycosylase domain-containing protein [Alkalitalea saponilacus]ASB49337.1 peptidoglycan glycosyltransferase [Alkalitalea saponilacus]SKC22226.1 penicillin-binding protein 1A [Alkalitalea saponilacus]
MVKSQKSAKRNTSEPTYGKKIFLWGLRISGFILSFVLIFIMLIYAGLFGRLPSKTDIGNIKNHTASVVYSADGQMIGTYFLQNRLTIDNDIISEHVKNALISTEDSRFFEHKGLDLKSMGRVLFKNIILGDRSQGGGSTISQQLAKNLYPRSSKGVFGLFIDKTREMIIAHRLESVFSKNEILNLYLNTVPFGEEVFGIEVAARRFFGKSSSSLTLPESATLVGMLAANTAFNPRRNPDRSVARRNIVIDRMAANGYISAEEAEKQKTVPLRTSYSRIDYNHGPAPWFIEHVRTEAANILKQEYGNQYNIFTDGLKIHTTLDASLQIHAVAAVKSHMAYLQRTFDNHWGNRDPWHENPGVFENALRRTERYRDLERKGLDRASIIKELEKPFNMTIFTHEGEKNAQMSPIDSVKHSLRTLHTGFLAMNPTTGHVLAWVGGVDFKFYRYDHVKARRQAGSTFKPFVYASAIHKGFNPCEFISNEQKTYARYNDWTPANADGKHEGYYSMKGGLIHSANTIAADVIHRSGINETIQMARKLGIESDIPNVPSIALGTAEISLLEMVSAYTAFPNYGRAIKPLSVLRIENNRGEILYEAPRQFMLDEAFNEETARIMIQVMKEVIEKGTGRALYSRYQLRGEYGGKTGTTQNNADGWFIGYTPTMVAGAWVGAENPAISFRTLALGQGAHTALPIFGRFMQQAEQHPDYAHVRTSRFYPLPEDLMAYLDCDDFVEHLHQDDDRNFFQRLFGGSSSREQDDEKEPDEEVKDKNLINRMRGIFRRDD